MSELEIWFPHILNVVEGIWGTIELDSYLNQLIIADKNGRDGFPSCVMSELIMLYSINDELIKNKSNDIWKNRP